MKKSQKVILTFMLLAIMYFAAFPPTLTYKKTSCLSTMTNETTWIDEDYVLDNYNPDINTYFETRRLVFRTRTSLEHRQVEMENLGKFFYTYYIKYSIDIASLLAEIVVIICLGMAIFFMFGISRHKKDL